MNKSITIPSFNPRLKVVVGEFLRFVPLAHHTTRDYASKIFQSHQGQLCLYVREAGTRPGGPKNRVVFADGYEGEALTHLFIRADRRLNIGEFAKDFRAYPGASEYTAERNYQPYKLTKEEANKKLYHKLIEQRNAYADAFNFPTDLIDKYFAKTDWESGLIGAL